MTYTAKDFILNPASASAEELAALNDALSYLEGSSYAVTILDGMFAKGVKIMVLPGKDVFRYNPFPGMPGYHTNVWPGINIDCPANTIVWDPNAALVVTDAPDSSSPGVAQGVQSPAIRLIHEGAHSTDPNLATDSTQSNAQYDWNSEAYAVACEDAVAAQLHEVLRFNHTGAQYDDVILNPTVHTVDVPNADGTFNYQEQFFEGKARVGWAE